jgi:hypothetical protein
VWLQGRISGVLGLRVKKKGSLALIKVGLMPLETMDLSSVLCLIDFGFLHEMD